MSNIVITGANQGIGYYFVEQALKNGNKVAVLDIKTDNLESLEQSFSDKLLRISYRNYEKRKDYLKKI